MPEHVFQPLTALEVLALFGNPGAPFIPQRDANQGVTAIDLGITSGAYVNQSEAPPGNLKAVPGNGRWRCPPSPGSP